MPSQTLCHAVDVYFCTVGLPILVSLVVIALNELRDDPGHTDVPRPSPRYSYTAAPASPHSRAHLSSSSSSSSPSPSPSFPPQPPHLQHHRHSSSLGNNTNNNKTITTDSHPQADIMVADALVYHPTMAHLLKYTSTVTGRDKVLRTLQYFARFYAWYLLRTNGTKDEIAPWETMKKQFGTTRKLLRVGKNLEHIKAAAVAADSKTLDPVLRYLAIGRQLGYAGYLSLDLTTVLHATGIRKWEGAKRAQQEAYRFWAIGLLCSAISQIYTQYKLRERESSISLKDGEGVVEKKKIEK